MSQNEEDAFSHLLDLTSDPEKINCVFPLVQQKLHLPRQRTPSPHAESRSNSRNSQQRPSSRNEKAKEAENDDLQCHSRRNTIATKGKQPHNQRFAMPAYTRRDTMPSKHAAPGSPKLRQPPQTTISQELVTNANEQTEKQITSSMLSLKHQSQSGPAFLHVDQQLERAQSADMLFLKPGNDDDELRRASFDTHSTSVIHTNGTSALHLHTGRRPGTGRKLPSTERLEQMHQNAQKH
ncbi:hypothetical protein M3Y97_00514700 [Aphelenchoides bicaudatus]|nr:hypothetical protein M3Y97_00514700 [Aphelenchoides bicaudatus]